MSFMLECTVEKIEINNNQIYDGSASHCVLLPSLYNLDLLFYCPSVKIRLKIYGMC